MDTSQLALRMRDRGRSLTEIADSLDMRVPEVKALLAPVKAERRQALSRTPSNEKQRGLLDPCAYSQCGHNRKDHGEDGQCRICGPERVVYEITTTDEDGRHPRYSESDVEPTRPEGVAYNHWWYRTTERGCESFMEKDDVAAMFPWMRRKGPPSLDPRPKPSDVKREGYKTYWGSFTGTRRNGGPQMPQVARKRKRNPGSRGKSYFKPPQ